MAEITAVRDVELGEPITTEALNSCVLKAFGANFSKVRLKKNNQFICRVKTMLFNPIVSLKCTIDCKVVGNKGKVMVVAKSSTNFWFWFTFLLMLVPPMTLWGYALMYWMWSSQEKKTIGALKQSMDQFRDQLSFQLWNQNGTQPPPNGDPTKIAA